MLGLSIGSEKLYIKLQSFLYDNFDYVGAFAEVIKKYEKLGHRCLVYAKSKEQADQFALEIDNVSRFPDTSGTHLAISLTQGTYGLNHLIYLDTIVSLVQNPDVLPQMKGRLDRPGQTRDVLNICYIYIENTIDRAGKIRLEMANNFYNDYLMPLAEFYDIAVSRKKISS